jgi:hypothetical protein
MKIVKILGGLGNQMSQYALFLSLKEHFSNERILVDTSFFKDYSLHNGLELGRVFKVPLPQARFLDLLKVTYPLYYYKLWQLSKFFLPPRSKTCRESMNMEFDDTVLTKAGDRYFDGYWQGEFYFKDNKEVIRNTFKFIDSLDIKNARIVDKLNTSDSISIHIRRGDYLKYEMYRGICDLDYYVRAITYIKKRIESPFFCIFSNDINWCKENLYPLLLGNSLLFVDWNSGENSYKDMQLMSVCKHNIIANSSFSWWGAWLNSNSNKIVIAPSKWLNIDLKMQPQFVKGWILI